MSLKLFLNRQKSSSSGCFLQHLQLAFTFLQLGLQRQLLVPVSYHPSRHDGLGVLGVLSVQIWGQPRQVALVLITHSVTYLLSN